ncbi:hypothetical protein BCR33DRAFT_639057, partial [Rhizoclosmatium globosum]
QDLLDDDFGVPLLLIFGSDAALATKIGKQSFHPVVLTLGNIKKNWRKVLNNYASRLVTYIPIVKASKNSQLKSGFLTAYKRAVYHSALGIAFESIKNWIQNGVELVSPDGLQRRFFPCLFNWNADYPEAALVSTVSP